ncbi:MAG: hypothetical protein COV45_01525 [Deltaproteobacteria bacterium CG11_big_fil_rev_8_21_14_0_20_47_16]|nr:MAG: hypothetical protein COV45_01525 [Deltaproteobacteria bacterium CG11_big_fil_rev_8_21_14_0_20_47_16]
MTKRYLHMGIAVSVTTLMISYGAFGQGRPAVPAPSYSNSARSTYAAPKPNTSTTRVITITNKPSARSSANQRPTQAEQRKSVSVFDRFFNLLNSLEVQHGRYHGKQEVADMLHNSSIFASDVGRYADEFGNPGNLDNSDSVMNTIYKDASDAELASFAMGLIAEQSVQNNLKSQFEKYQGQEAANLQKQLAIEMNPTLAIQKWIEMGKKTEDENKKKDGSDLPGSVPTSVAGFNKSQLPLSGGGASFISGSCLKKFGAALPSGIKGGSGGSSFAGDVPPDSGGAAPGGMGPDGKPVTLGQSVKQGTFKADCGGFDYSKADSDGAVGKPPEGANVYKTSNHIFKGEDGMGRPYATKVELTSYEHYYPSDPATKRIQIAMTVTVTDLSTGKTAFSDGKISQTVAGGPAAVSGEWNIDTASGTLPVNIQVKLNNDNYFEYTAKGLIYASGGWGKIEKWSYSSYGEKGSGYQWINASNKTENPMDEKTSGANAKQQCLNAAFQTAGDCAMSFIAGIKDGVTAIQSLNCMGVGGGGAAGMPVDGSNPVLACAKKMGIEGLDQMKMFMKMGGGFSDPIIMQQVQTNTPYNNTRVQTPQQNQMRNQPSNVWYKR